MTNPNKAELRRLAEAAMAGDWFKAGDLLCFDMKTGESHGLNAEDDRFIAAATPVAVKSLLDECDKKDSLLEEYKRGGRCALELLEDAEAERDAALAELAELREELAGVKNVSTETAKAMKRLVMCARTSGGTAGSDAGLMEACEQAEKILSLGGIGRAYMEGADAAMSQEVGHG